MAHEIRGSRRQPKAKQAKGTAQKAKLVDDLKAVNKEIDARFKVSEKLFVKKDKIRAKLGI